MGRYVLSPYGASGTHDWPASVVRSSSTGVVRHTAFAGGVDPGGGGAAHWLLAPQSQPLVSEAKVTPATLFGKLAGVLVWVLRPPSRVTTTCCPPGWTASQVLASTTWACAGTPTPYRPASVSVNAVAQERPPSCVT